MPEDGCVVLKFHTRERVFLFNLLDTDRDSCIFLPENHKQPAERAKELFE